LTLQPFFWSLLNKFQTQKGVKEMEKEAGQIIQKAGVPVRYIGVIGSRTLGFQWADKVGLVVEDVLARGYNIASGGAIGADQFVVEKLLQLGQCNKATIYAAWQNYDGFPIKVRAMTRQFRQYDGAIVWGQGNKNNPPLARLALLLRNQRLVEACYGLVAFINPDSRGSIFTIKKAVQKHLPLVVFPVNCELPTIPSVKWVALRCGGVYEDAYKAVYLR
jgi:hypothetical protein